MENMHIGARIKAERLKYGISQKQLAQAIGIDPSVYSRIERGERELSIENLISISKTLNTETDYLILGVSNVENSENVKGLLKQARKLNKYQYELLANIIAVLIENSDRWEMSGTQSKNPSAMHSGIVDYKQIGRRIRAERSKQNLTIEKLSEYANLSETFLGNIERAAAIPSLESLFRIAGALKIPVTRLLINADKEWKTTGLCGTLEELARYGENKSALILSLIAVLIDNSDKW